MTTNDPIDNIHNAIRDVALDIQRMINGEAISRDDASLDTLLTDVQVTMGAHRSYHLQHPQKWQACAASLVQLEAAAEALAHQDLIYARAHVQRAAALAGLV